MKKLGKSWSILSAEYFKWAEAGSAWTSQCIERNGKFYYYATLKNRWGRNIGVAVADNPAGPFKDALEKALTGPNLDYIAPTVFIDNDGQEYLIWGKPNFILS